MLKIFNRLDLTDGKRGNGTIIKQKLEAHFSPKSNQGVERHEFNNRVQGANESFDNFVKDLEMIAASCDYEG